MNLLVCSAQVPFQRGGAEMLAESLVAELSARGHRTDLIALPYKWYPTAEIFKSALAWRLLDLARSNGTRVDRVIALKFPSYVIPHPHKVVWLVHQFRQVYDWFGTPLSDFSDSAEDSAARARIVEMDRRALGEARARYAISKNVAGRLARFNGLEARPLYPPPRLAARLHPGDYGDYILYLGRLDRAKRVDLLIRALARIRNGRAIIAGTGPEQEALQQLAENERVSERIRFEGFVDDARAIELYAQARAVFYAPVDEDYGFSTVEAFLSERPVVTTADAGGVLEFVEHAVSGLVTAPQLDAIATALARMLESPEPCRAWGRAGRERVRGITWDNAIAHLLA